MAAEAVQYIQGQPVLQDGLNIDQTLLCCSECETYYHVHYSNAEAAWLPELGLQASEKINTQHPNHIQTISLTHDGVYPVMKK
jgi:hypothetical protein